MADNLQGFIGNLNQLVQEYFAEIMNTYDPVAFSNYPDKYSYIYEGLIKTKGPDMIKLSNMQNYLSDWDRGYTFGGFVRAMSIGPALPIDPPTFANGSDPNNGMIMKPNIAATYHPLKVRLEFFTTQFNTQLRETVNNIDELSAILAGTLNSLVSGANDTSFRLRKELFYKFYSELSASLKTSLTNTSLPATIASKDDAIKAVNTIRNYITEFMFGTGDYSALNFKHIVTPDRARLYVTSTFANALVDYLKLDHNMGDGPNYANIAGNLSLYLGVPTKILNDFGGKIPYDSNDAQLYPIYTADGMITGTYAATEGGTTVVAVDHWGDAADYNFRAVLTEDDFGNVFPVNDELNTQYFLRGGGYINTSRYIEQILVANPHSNTVYFQ